MYDVTNGEIPVWVQYQDKRYVVPKFKAGPFGRHLANPGIAIDGRDFGYLETQLAALMRQRRAIFVDKAKTLPL